MEPLKIYRKIFGIICCCSYENETDKWIKYRNILISMILLMLEMTMWISSLVYFWLNFEEDFEDSLYAIFQATATFGAFYTLCIGLLLRKRLIEFFPEFESFYKTC